MTASISRTTFLSASSSNSQSLCCFCSWYQKMLGLSSPWPAQGWSSSSASSKLCCFWDEVEKNWKSRNWSCWLPGCIPICSPIFWLCVPFAPQRIYSVSMLINCCLCAASLCFPGCPSPNLHADGLLSCHSDLCSCLSRQLASSAWSRRSATPDSCYHGMSTYSTLT